MINRIFKRLVIALGHQIKSLVLFAAVIILATSLYLITYPNSVESKQTCSDLVASLVAGNKEPESIEQAHLCFSPNTRYAQMPAEQFAGFVNSATSTPHPVKLIGKIAGSDAATHGYNYTIATYAILDGYPESVITLFLDNNGKVEIVQVG